MSFEPPVLTRRSFRPDDPLIRPFSSADMLGHIAAFGPPEILCVWGLGVDEAILEACAQSVRVYNSIDAPALRVPESVSRHFDIVITGAEWQSQEVNKRHPDMLTAVMPIGPEFASPETFYPMGIEKVYDVVYVAAAQPYKKHEVLFNALGEIAANHKRAVRVRLRRTRGGASGSSGRTWSFCGFRWPSGRRNSPKSTG